MTTTTDEDGPLDPSTGYPDPGGFEDGDDVDSAAVDEEPDGYEPPADPEAEPAAHPGDDEPGDDD